jgi:hypothetical protein
MKILVTLKDKDIAVRFFGTFKKDLIAFNDNVGFLCRFDTAFFRKQVVTIMFISSILFGIINSWRKELIGVFFEGNLMEVLLAKIWSINTNLLDEVELVVGLVVYKIYI